MIITPVRKALADISMMMWLHCHSVGLKARVQLSHHTWSRYLMIGKNLKIRISDHRAVSGEDYDYEIIVWSAADIEAKKAEANDLLLRIVGGEKAVAA